MMGGNREQSFSGEEIIKVSQTENPDYQLRDVWTEESNAIFFGIEETLSFFRKLNSEILVNTTENLLFIPYIWGK